MPRIHNSRASAQRAAAILARLVDYGEPTSVIAERFGVHPQTVRTLAAGIIHRGLSRAVPSVRMAVGGVSSDEAEDILDRQLDLIVAHRLWGERAREHARRRRPARRTETTR